MCMSISLSMCISNKYLSQNVTKLRFKAKCPGVQGLKTRQLEATKHSTTAPPLEAYATLSVKQVFI